MDFTIDVSTSLIGLLKSMWWTFLISPEDGQFNFRPRKNLKEKREMRGESFEDTVQFYFACKTRLGSRCHYIIIVIKCFRCRLMYNYVSIFNARRFENKRNQLKIVMKFHLKYLIQEKIN